MFGYNNRWQREKLEQIVEHLGSMSGRGSFKLDMSQVAYLIALAVGAVYAFARIELYMHDNTRRIDSIEAKEFTQTEWMAERALIDAELRAMDSGLQRLCQEVVASAKRNGESPSLECPITVRGERNGPRTP